MEAARIFRELTNRPRAWLGQRNGETRERLGVGPAPRGGNSYTLNSTGGSNSQRFGGLLSDHRQHGRLGPVRGHERPRQSGDPERPFYDNLFELWANGEFFPVYCSRERIDRVARDVIAFDPEK
jgi:penicillin amidase